MATRKRSQSKKQTAPAKAEKGVRAAQNWMSDFLAKVDPVSVSLEKKPKVE